MGRPCPIRGIAISQDCIECDDKICKKKTIVIGLDQSYENTGISLIVDNNIKKIDSLDLSVYKSKTQKRTMLQKRLEEILAFACKKGNVVCVIERIRQFSQGFININYIKSIGALNACIVDTCYRYEVPVYSVDTRAWKAAIVGSSKPKENIWNTPPEKWPMIEWLIEQGYEKQLLIPIENQRKKNGVFEKYEKRWMYNNDAADSVGIGLFWFRGDRNKLELER